MNIFINMDDMRGTFKMNQTLQQSSFKQNGILLVCYLSWLLQLPIIFNYFRLKTVIMFVHRHFSTKYYGTYTFILTTQWQCFAGKSTKYD